MNTHTHINIRIHTEKGEVHSKKEYGKYCMQRVRIFQ